VFGVPVYVDPAVPAMAANAKSIVGADWSRVYVRQVGPVRFERSDDFAWSSDLATYRCLTTLDSALVDSTGALKWFANSAT
jgi:HK97 family phage major capsid protein